MEDRKPAPGVEGEALERVRSLPGVIHATLLAEGDRSRLVGLASPHGAENRGVAEVLRRQRVLCLFKDRGFRPPPEPTVLLVDGRGEVIGREVLDEGDDVRSAGVRVVHLGKNFVLFPGRRTVGDVRFLLPPIRFPELEGHPGIARVVSGSPDPTQDEYLRRLLRIPQGKELASVLVGFDIRNP